MALSTDYDCWHEGEEDVSIEAILETLSKNVSNAKKIIRKAVGLIPPARTCKCSSALKYAIVTDRNMIPEETKKKLKVIMGKYI